MKTAQINLHNHAVRTRVKGALDWCWWNLSTETPSPVHSRTLTEVMGTRTVGDWLRTLLLERSGSYCIGKKAFDYCLIEAGFNLISDGICGPTYAELQELYAPPQEIIVPEREEITLELLLRPRTKLAQHQFHPGNHLEKGLPLTFEYEDKQARLWNNLQNIHSDHKPRYWAGALDYNYDIVNCAPSTLLQLAERTHMSSLLLQPVYDYLSNRGWYVELIQDLSYLDRKKAKKLLIAMLNGAPLSTSYKHSTFRLLKKNREAVEQLKSSFELRALLSSFKGMRKHLERHYQQPAWNIYFEQERAMLEVMRGHLERAGATYFLEHDGFRCDRPLDTTQLVQAIKKKTGFDHQLKVEHTVIIE